MSQAHTRYFTLEEANACLPRLRQLLEELQEVQREINASRPEVWPVLQKAIGNGGNQRASELLKEFRRLERAVEGIQETGCLLKDAEQGLVDFLSRRDGREVYLCWRRGEDQIRCWHELHTGFAGRQPL